jgi:pyridoxal phosphate enzyme (YggS family)
MMICENIKHIENAIRSIKNSDSDVKLVAVTKTFPYQDVLSALKCGIKHIGESKIQEALPKFEQLGTSLIGIDKHFIGHLQTNKAKKAVENFDLIHSLDTLKLAESINTHAFAVGKIQECLIEIKISYENSKTGVAESEAMSFYERCLDFKNISIKGLMTIAPNECIVENVRPYFKRVCNLFKTIGQTFKKEEFNILSMGMSADFEIAVQEGSNLVRVGSAIFGKRNYGNK